MARKKRMTAAEKARRVAVKRELQKEGILPPDKLRLNRKKYIEETIEAWERRSSDCWVWDIYLSRGIGIMLAAKDRRMRVSPEAVGVAKALLIAMRLKEFSEKLKEEGREAYTLKEEYEHVKDILKA